MIYKIILHKQQVYIRPFNLIPVIAEIYLYHSFFLFFSYFHLHILAQESQTCSLASV